MSIRVYAGEYLITPYPLHLDLNKCSHNCSYCFASLSDRSYDVDYRDMMTQFIKAEKKIGKSLVKWFLHHKYPILISNTSDPFAKSNEGLIEQITEFSNSHQIPICWQTKGGSNAEEILLNQKPSSVYISITTDKEDIRKRHEPGTFSIEQRIELAESCMIAGHYVEIGLNPFIAAWWDDPKAMVDRLISKGLKRFILAPIHMSRYNREHVDSRLDDAFIQYAMKKKKPDQTFIDNLSAYIESIGGRVDHITDHNIQLETHNFHDYFKITNNPWYPTIHEWVHTLEAIRKKTGKPVLYTARDFTEWANVGVDIECSAYNQYLNNWGRSIRNIGQDIRPVNFHEVHEVLFNVSAFATPFRTDRTFYAIDGDSIILDDDGNFILIHDTEHKKEAFRRVKDCIFYKEVQYAKVV